LRAFALVGGFKAKCNDGLDIDFVLEAVVEEHLGGVFQRSVLRGVC